MTLQSLETLDLQGSLSFFLDLVDMPKTLRSKWPQPKRALWDGECLKQMMSALRSELRFEIRHQLDVHHLSASACCSNHSSSGLSPAGAQIHRLLMVSEMQC